MAKQRVLLVNSEDQIVDRILIDPERGPYRPKAGLRVVPEAEAASYTAPPDPAPFGPPLPMPAFLRALRELGLLTKWKSWIKAEQLGDEVAALREIGPGVLYYDAWIRALELDLETQRRIRGETKRAAREIFG